jgi:hypothetical protein
MTEKPFLNSDLPRGQKMNQTASTKERLRKYSLGQKLQNWRPFWISHAILNQTKTFFYDLCDLRSQTNIKNIEERI